MTWREFLAALSDAGLTQKAFSVETETDAAVVNRWQHRVRGVPRWVPLWFLARNTIAKSQASSPAAKPASRRTRAAAR